MRASIGDEAWRGHGGLIARIEEGVKELLGSCGLERFEEEDGMLGILLTNDERVRELNRNFRGKDEITDVLAFEGEGGYLGDIALAYGYARGFARREGIDFSDHAMRLALHGVLHLLGYRHDSDAEHQKMQERENYWLGRV